MAQTKPSQGRRFLNAGLAVLGFVVVCAILRAILPFPEIGVVASHIRFFKKHRNEYDTLFIGSSLTHRQISPAIFDRVMAERGHPTRSFNFGVDGMRLSESSYVLERILATKPKRLKWVFLEFDELEIRPFAGAEGSRREVYWRDWKRTSLLLQKLLAGDDTESFSYASDVAIAPELDPHKTGLRELLQFHLTLFAKNITNVSRRVDLAWWGSHFWKPDKMPNDLGPNGDGYVPLNQEMPEERRMTYQWRLEQERAHKGNRLVSAATEQAYREMVAEVTKVGATPVFLGMPVLSHVRLEFRPESGLTGPVLLFNDEQSYPELYRPELRAEEVHLNHRGTEEFSTLVARQFSERIREDRVR